jgi:transforming growth factor-beta-induced protein
LFLWFKVLLNNYSNNLKQKVMNTTFKNVSWVAKLRTTLFTMALISFVAISCNEDDAAPTRRDSIVAIAQGNSNFSILVAALTKFPDLVETLNGEGNFTVFAPTNAAFTALLSAVGQTSLDDIPEDVLRDILEYHVLGVAVRSNQLVNGTVATVGGELLTVSTTNGFRLNNTVNIVTTNLLASNGIVHVIDAVLVPPSITPIVGTIVAPAYFNKNFTTLIAAVKAASPSILQTLLNSNKKTLFAPTNAAFAAAGITTLPGQATLDAVLTYHVLNGEVRAADIATGSSAPTTLNGKIYLSKGTAGVFINGTTQVTTTDIVRSNGVVHVINRTLLPPSKTIAQIAIDASTSAAPQFTQLVAALSKVPALLTAASSAGDLTVFAPTDAAFQALYTTLGVANMNELEAAIGNDKLAEVLQHHIVGARVFSTDLSSGSVNTLNQSVTINVSNLTVTDAIGSTPAGLVSGSLNILGTNGVIHAINRVLIPTGILD